MAESFSRLIRELNRGEITVEGRCSETWSARHEPARQAIRESLQRAFADWNADDLEALQNLSEPPRPHGRSVSVSHTLDFGGWMAVSRPAQIGWDVELKRRVKEEIIRRVCTAEEIAACPAPPLLWSAKEAYFKALEDEQPEVIQQLTITDWKALAPDLWSWKGLGPRNGDGVALDSEPWIMAGCLVR